MYACGYRTGLWWDTTRPDWDNTGPRPLSWAAWYPVARTAAEEAAPLTAHGIFDLGSVYRNHPLAAGGPWPVVLLSHGTGGSAESLGWLARALACRGAVVLAAQHHGNTSQEPYRAEGFLCWWERARDLSALLNLCVTTQDWCHEALDLDHVSVVGYSLGAHTALSLGGAITSMSLLVQWQNASARAVSGPREFPDLADRIPLLLERSEVFRASWARQGDDHRDPRVGAIVAIAPPPPVRALTPESLRAIKVPVTLIAGGADVEAPASIGAGWLQATHPGFALHDVGSTVGHHAFLGLPSVIGRLECPELFTDAAGVMRSDVHRNVVQIISKIS
jgi:predicted dienelactone hydrolase